MHATCVLQLQGELGSVPAGIAPASKHVAVTTPGPAAFQYKLCRNVIRQVERLLRLGQSKPLYDAMCALRDAGTDLNPTRERMLIRRCSMFIGSSIIK